MDVRGEKLFREMATQGSVAKYLGNQEFIEVPNKDFYYNAQLNRWDYTPNSSWRFLEDVKNQEPKISN
jgi:hypothetical protein